MSMFDPVALQKLKSDNDLVTIIGAVVSLRRVGSVYRGACPWCGGSKLATKFAVLPARQTYKCHHCGRSGDVVSFVRDIRNMSFPEAIEYLGGMPTLSEKDRKVLARAVEREKKADAKRVAEKIARARLIWDETLPGAGTLVEAYLRFRGIGPDVLPFGWPKPLRFHPNLPYWCTPKAASPYILCRCPAMVAGISAPDGSFMGVHCTWLNEDGRGKKKLVDRHHTVLDAKKVKGTQKGGAIRLTPRQPALFVGEGIETTLSALYATAQAGKVGYGAWCGISLGNIAGGSSGSLPHPQRAGFRVPSRNPDLDNPGFVPPQGVDEAILLGDGDSDRITTENQLFCAAARYRQSHMRCRISFADEGTDFNDMLRACT